MKSLTKYNLPIPYDVKTGIANEIIRNKNKGQRCAEKYNLKQKYVLFEVGEDVLLKRNP